MTATPTHDAANMASRIERLAKSRWGDVPVTVRTTSHADGSYNAIAFHTMCTSADYDLDGFDAVRATLLAKSDGELREYIGAVSTEEGQYLAGPAIVPDASGLGVSL